MHEPYTYLNGLDATDLEDLIEDIKVYKLITLKHNISKFLHICTFFFKISSNHNPIIICSINV